MKCPSYRYIILFITLLTFSDWGMAQTRVYEAFIEGSKVGEMHVQREVNDESEKIYIRTQVEAYKSVRSQVDYESHSTYMNEKLMEATTTNKANAHAHSESHTIWKHDHYEVTVGKEQQILEAQTLLGIDLLYLEEPIGFKQIYALSTGDLIDVLSDRPHEYYFQHADKKELYKYENGELSELRLEYKGYTIVFKRSHQ